MRIAAGRTHRSRFCSQVKGTVAMHFLSKEKFRKSVFHSKWYVCAEFLSSVMSLGTGAVTRLPSLSRKAKPPSAASGFRHTTQVLLSGVLMCGARRRATTRNRASDGREISRDTDPHVCFCDLQ